MSTCQATRQDGQPCTLAARSGTSWCWAHDPSLDAQRRAGAASGGRNKSLPRRLERATPATMRPVLAMLHEALAGLKDGSVDPRVGTAMASVAGAIVRVHEVAQLEVTLEETQARLAALERGQQA